MDKVVIQALIDSGNVITPAYSSKLGLAASKIDGPREAFGIAIAGFLLQDKLVFLHPKL